MLRNINLYYSNILILQADVFLLGLIVLVLLTFIVGVEGT